MRSVPRLMSPAPTLRLDEFGGTECVSLHLAETTGPAQGPFGRLQLDRGKRLTRHGFEQALDHLRRVQDLRGHLAAGGSARQQAQVGGRLTGGGAAPKHLLINRVDEARGCRHRSGIKRLRGEDRQLDGPLVRAAAQSASPADIWRPDGTSPSRFVYSVLISIRWVVGRLNIRSTTCRGEAPRL